MTPQEIAANLVAKFGDAIIESFPDDKHPRVCIMAEHWRAVAEHLYGEADLSFDWLGCLSGVDYVADNQLASVCDLRSTKHHHWFAVKVLVDRDHPHIPSVMDLWPAADWHEREAFDMFGIIYDGHTDLRRILCPEDWVGFPLRKDYQFPREYHGIPGTTEMDWQQQSNYPA
jgi:NADH-quinone oxidoreductase subunit C